MSSSPVPNGSINGPSSPGTDLTGPQIIAVVGVGVGGVVAIVAMCLCYCWFRQKRISAEKERALVPLQAIASPPANTQAPLSRQTTEFQRAGGEQSHGYEDRLHRNKTIESTGTGSSSAFGSIDVQRVFAVWIRKVCDNGSGVSKLATGEPQRLPSIVSMVVRLLLTSTDLLYSLGMTSLGDRIRFQNSINELKALVHSQQLSQPISQNERISIQPPAYN
ncbi:hypothetical protein BCR33DRAFT_719982 [Rhizoclosmatium globosum]|uniref:Uncharacterized protein n=1 Tax=Rhizoclosmatium globosum TaxID=329046 RepID=A0A1Y2BXX7_9FUNG|nr:hypothetical protein BCR33DRAFT_719982 [Rhizoclosmatium globosum]|eukprot:ORY39507.1 hypothetical protein BCR33DRAFT_719982 [Rhizoclosmatium globosum]